MARPGANVTGFSISPGEGIFSKRIQMLREAVPRLATVAFLTPRLSWEGRFGVVMRSMAQEVGVTAVGATLNAPINEAEYESACAGLLRNRPETLIVTDHAENYVNQRAIVKLAADARLPAIYPFREAVAAGGLLAYSADVSDIHRQVASYIDRILRGEKPADLPIQQPTKFQLGVNLKTAKTLGLTIPPSLLLRADQVIE